MSLISQCRVCNSKNIEDFFDLGIQPFANALIKNKQIKEEKYPLVLSYCKDCSLVQLNYTASPEELFSNYVWVTGTSKVAKEYSKQFCDILLTYVSEIKKDDYILEVASNDGTFLKPFVDKGLNVLGIDPAENIVNSANATGINTKCSFFSEKEAINIKNKKGSPKIIFARNVLPHVANLHDFVKGLEVLLKEDALLAIEFHYSGIICNQLHYDSIYHEHLCYFSIKTIEILLNQYGLNLFDIKESSISGGSFVLFIKKGNVEQSEKLKQYKQEEKNNNINSFDKWKEFSQKSSEHKKEFCRVVEKQLNQNKKIAGYGASARSSTLLNFCGIDNKSISIIADQNSIKQGLYTPGTNILIEKPEIVFDQNPDVIIVLAWNFFDEILEIIKKQYNYKGKIISPLPKVLEMELI